MRKLARFLNKCHNIRFPEDGISESKKIRDGMESKSHNTKKTSSSKKKEKKKKHKERNPLDVRKRCHY